MHGILAFSLMFGKLQLPDNKSMFMLTLQHSQNTEIHAKAERKSLIALKRPEGIGQRGTNHFSENGLGTVFTLGTKLT